MNYPDIGLVLEIVGFLFAFGTFRVIFVAIAEILLMLITISKIIMRYSDGSTSLKDQYQNNKIRATDLAEEYHDSVLSKKPQDETRMPALVNILKFTGWILVTSGLILQFSYFNQSNP